MLGPTVSVCIPAFQADSFIGDAIQSVVDQSFTDWELVVLDNASTDRTATVVEGFNDSRIRLVSNPTNIPVGANWNRVVSFATGTYVKVLPADDVLYENCLEAQVDVLAARPAVSLVACCRDFLDPGGRVVMRRRGIRGIEGERSAEEVLRQIIRSGINLVGEPGSMLFRRSDFAEAGGFDESVPLVMDLELATRLLQLGLFYGQRESMTGFRLGGRSLTARSIGAQVDQHRALLESIGHNPALGLKGGDVRRGEIASSVASVERRLRYRLASLRT